MYCSFWEKGWLVNFLKLDLCFVVMVSYMQRRIELSVTNGIGYNSQTDFSRSFSIYSKYIDGNDIKNISKGLNAHLRELECPEVVKYSKILGFLYSSGGKRGGRRMEIRKLSLFGHFLNRQRNEMAVDLAYRVEAKRRGRIGVVLCGVIKQLLENDVVDVVSGVMDL